MVGKNSPGRARCSFTMTQAHEITKTDLNAKMCGQSRCGENYKAGTLNVIAPKNEFIWRHLSNKVM